MLTMMEGDIEGLEETKDVIQKNEKRIASLKRIIKKYKDDGKNSDTMKRSYAAKIGSRTRWYNDAVDDLGEIYKLSINKRLKNIDNFKARIQEICEEYKEEFCPECIKSKPHCIC